MRKHDGSRRRARDRRTDLCRGRRRAVVGVHRKAEGALAQLLDDGDRDVVVVSGTRAEPGRRFSGQCGESRLVGADLVHHLVGRTGSGYPVCRPSGDRQGDMPRAVVAELE